MSENIQSIYSDDHTDVSFKADAATANSERLAQGQDAADKSKRKERIKPDALNAEREAVLAILNDNPDAQIMAVAADRDVPPERLLRYWIEWQSTKSKSSVIQFSMIQGILKDRFKSATGAPLKADTPMSLEFDDDMVIITPYKKSISA